MTFFRWLVGLPAAAIVTTGLFVFMAALIAQERGPLPNPIEYAKIKILADPPPPPTKIKPRPPQRTDPPPPADIPTADPQRKPDPIGRVPTGVDPDFEPDRGGGNAYAPTIRIAPPYPENCRSKNAQGVVTVQFNVAPDGRVIDPQIISSDHSCFNRTVIRTILKWKYPPARQGGRAVMRYGVVEVFRFTLEG